jgi:hypothetical protein
MARVTITAKLGGERLEDLRGALAAVDGVRSVRDRDGALDVEYDDTLVGQNKLIEVSREHHGEPEIPIPGPSNSGMTPTR